MYTNKLIRDKISNLGEEVIFFRYIYQTDNDISLFRYHVDDISKIKFISTMSTINRRRIKASYLENNI